MAKLIFDVGMHKGEDTDFYLSRGFHVVGVEANPCLVQYLKAKYTAEIADGRVTIVDKAISYDRGPIKLALFDDISVWGSTDAGYVNRNRAVGHEPEFVTVDGVPFAEILDAYGIPYYLKIDIEGCDMLCIQALHRFAHRPKYVSMESSVTGAQSDFARSFAELAHLWVLGYHEFKYVDQSTLNRLNGLTLEREGTQIRYAYVKESSGPFGEETPGSWKSVEQAVREMQRIRLHHSLFGWGGKYASNLAGKVARRLRRYATGRVHSWYDLHARLS